MKRIFKHKMVDSKVELFDPEGGKPLGSATLSDNGVEFSGDVPEEMKRTLSSMLKNDEPKAR